ncbi:hypothetical protein COU00_04045 [Candidatus Falkowbacteria bacterium CG10_big_fil_rev_8_21_14_0_10_43_11]|uniref:Porin n=1 Tax=Candidatus Falkowbacteria bacterium CG10_big_fil_rev_8_21_14_0_10_43_11 TaxID=1974568 RepID=A0A2M6WL57_9BACT|nr:MAG: hypothetical protein COU00_04045 [Candidatus Falkowbacteria bacterium CG10_big_fil_rev_8_21_14_0_10_43_11]
MKKLLVVAVALGILVPLAFGDEPKFSGELRIFSAAYLDDRTGAEDLFGEIRFLPAVAWQTDYDWFLYIQGDFRLDSENYASGVFDGVEDDGRWIGNLRQAYAEYTEDLFKLRVGKQIFDWSTTDTISPSDNINPRDWVDVAEWERIGVPAIDLRYGDATFWEFVYIPWSTPSKLPAGRWEYDLPPGLVSGGIDGPENDYDQFALRAGTNVSGWDLGASYYHGYSYNPSVSFQPPNAINTEYIREDVVAVSAVGEIGGGVMLRAEAGYFNQHGNNDFVQFVIGADRFWNDVFRTTDELYLLVQYTDEVETKNDNPAAFRIYDFRRAFRRSFMARAQYSFDDTRQWTLKLEGSYNCEDDDSYIQPSVAFRRNNLEIEAGIGFASGPKNTFWGEWRENDRIFIQCTYHF